MPNKHQLIIYYGELALKGKNRAFFEDKLISNIRLKLEDYDPEIKKTFGRLFLKVNSENQNEIIAKLRQIFGMSHFTFIEKAELSMTAIEKAALNIIKSKKFRSFGVITNRVNKNFEKDSEEINVRIGDIVRNKTGSEVDLDDPELRIHIAVLDDKAAIFTNEEDHEGLGGLPVGVSGKLTCLLSSGIDSPVAAYQMMKRGAEIIFVHFHSYPFTSSASIENCREILKVLARYQPQVKFYRVPIGEIQKKISVQAPSEYRIILYRRLMFMLANRIADKERALGLVTGESLGQVASQTLENMAATQAASDLPVYRPLIALDKQEIVDKAKELGTYGISIRPADDCCTYLAPPKVATKTRARELAELEKGWSEVIEDFEIFKIPNN